MKLITNNVLHGGSFSATSESLNYPVTNLDHPFLTKRFQASDDATTVTVVLPAASDVDAIGHGNTNASSIIARLYSGVDVLEETLELDLSCDPCLSYCAEKRIGITRIEFDIVTAEVVVKLGGLAAGVAFDLDYAYAGIDRPLIDNSIWQQLPGGQSLANNVKPLKTLPLAFDAENITIANSLITVYNNTGLGTPFFADFFVGKREFFPPMYCCFSAVPQDTGEGIARTIRIAFQECR